MDKDAQTWFRYTTIIQRAIRGYYDLLQLSIVSGIIEPKPPDIPDTWTSLTKCLLNMLSATPEVQGEPASDRNDATESEAVPGLGLPRTGNSGFSGSLC